MKNNKIIDAQLVDAYKAGDKNALTELVKRWHLVFCRKSYWIVKDAELSKDIAQETWRIIIDKIDTIKDSSSFGSWALRIVCSKSFDAIRKRKRDQIVENELRNTQSITDDTNDEKAALKQELLEAINRLSVQQQIIVKLFYTEEYSIKEISKTLDISVGTAKSRLFYAREKLKTILKYNDYEN